MRAVFLDRDGVINENRPDHVKNWSEFRFLPGTLEALKALAESDFLVFVITNQAIVNRGIVRRSTLDRINARMVQEIKQYGGRIDGVLCCPHQPEEGCECRKPKPGLLLMAARGHNVELRHSYVIGDAVADIQAGQAVGCEPIMVMSGRGLEQHELALRIDQRGYHLVPTLQEAVDLVLTLSAS